MEPCPRSSSAWRVKEARGPVPQEAAFPSGQATPLGSRSGRPCQSRAFCVQNIPSRSVAQHGSAPALGAGGRWFESSRSDHQKIKRSYLRGDGLFFMPVWCSRPSLLQGGKTGRPLMETVSFFMDNRFSSWKGAILEEYIGRQKRRACTPTECPSAGLQGSVPGACGYRAGLAGTPEGQGPERALGVPEKDAPSMYRGSTAAVCAPST